MHSYIILLHTIIVYLSHIGLKMKNKILTVLTILLWALCFNNISQAYTLTWDELTQLNQQKAIINNAWNYWVRDYYNQFSKRYNILKENDKLWSITKTLEEYSYSVFSKRKQTLRQQYSSDMTNFLNEYKNNITIKDEFPIDKCTWRYNTIDNISFANDFPTALTIAMRYRESTCAYYLPSNGDWPFQIVSKDYWTWEINEEIFTQAIQDFIDFAKNKIEKYNNRADNEYPAINLSYTWFDFTWMVNFAALYNGWTRTWWKVEPNAPAYIFDWYTDEYSTASRYWILPAFLTILDRELNNQ